MPRIEPEDFAEWNERMVRTFDPGDYHERSSLPVRAVERLRVWRILRYLDVPPGARVLEVGCGAGNVLERIHRAELHGVDISPYILDRARQRLGARAQLQQANAESLPYADATFDRVYCSEVLEHVIDPAKVVAEMRRVLKRDGLAVVSVPNERVINQAKGVLVRSGPVGRWVLGGGGDGYNAVENMQDHWHLHEFDEAMLRRVCAGPFRIVELAGVPAPAPLALRLVAKLLPV